jgi:hypothetical protein
VGGFNNGTTFQTLAESWNGTSWSMTSSLNTSATQYNDLSAVSCTGPSACTAVGFYQPTTITEQTLIEYWNGTTWSIVSSTNASTFDSLAGVSCSGASTCTAVGSFSNGTNSQTLVEAWNGASWSTVSSANISALQDNVLDAVSCTTASACTAAGFYFSGTVDQTLVESWNGTFWSIVSSPNSASSQDNSLRGVSCSGPLACRAVGSHSNGTFDQALVVAGVAGYRMVAADGGIFAFDAPFFGSMGGQRLNAPVVGIATDPMTGGYWEVAADGGIFAFNAPFFGSMGGVHLNQPVVGIAGDPATGG